MTLVLVQFIRRRTRILSQQTFVRLVRHCIDRMFYGGEYADAGELNFGIGTILAIEGLVELGMTPSQAIVAATKNGAIACRRLNEFGTLEAGKFADLVILDGDPLADIHNIRKLHAVFKEGREIDTSRLPEHPLLSRKLPAARSSIEN